MLKMITSADRGRIDLSGEITDDCGTEMVAMLSRLRDEGSYELIELWIGSQGGSVLAIRDFLRFARSRESGKPVVATHVQSEAASAAATLAALGDVRTAAEWATLRFHFSHATDIEDVTAHSAGKLRESIGRVDRKIVRALADRAMRAAGPPAGRRPTVRDFSRTDWPVVARLLDEREKTGNRRRRLARLRARIAGMASAAEMARLYTVLFSLEAPVSAVLAVELRLLDRVGVPEGRAAASDGGPHVVVPEWDGLYPDGRVPRSHLCRHALVMGETGSGKSASAVLPVVAAMLDPESPMGCMLAIDPKDELAAAVGRMAGPDVEVREIDPGTDRIDVMAGAHSVDGELRAANVVKAANRILCRAGTFDTGNPAVTLSGKQGGGVSDPYWADEGARLAQAIVAFVLLVRRRAPDIFGTTSGGGTIAGMDDMGAWARIVEFAERAGWVRRDPEIDRLSAECRDRAERGATAGDEFVAKVGGSRLHAESSGFRADMDKLLAGPQVSSWDEVSGTAVREFAVAVSLAAARSVEEPPSDGPNILALAGEALQSFFSIRPSTGYRCRLPAASVATQLNQDPRFRRGEAGYLLDEIRNWWEQLAESEKQYYGVVGMSRTVFTAFSDPVPSRALRFGCEGGGRPTIDFARDVDSGPGERRKVYVFRVGREHENELVARIVKAGFFEAVLNNPRRRRNGDAMPLACYVADEFHRFVTDGEGHGEQRYVDTCRSHGGCCILATQSVASLRKGLAGAVDKGNVDASVAVLVANTATKMVFRSTEAEVRGLVEQLCPGGPDQLPITAIRPPSTLAAGECYAALPDGRFARRQLRQFQPSGRAGPKPARAVGSGRKKGPERVA